MRFAIATSFPAYDFDAPLRSHSTIHAARYSTLTENNIKCLLRMSEPSAKRRKTDDGGTRITDPRFANIQSDPRYRLPSKKQKVKLDKRFTRKFKDEDFTRRAKVDRYGRPIQNDAEQRKLREKFELEDEDDDSSDEPDDDDEVQRELARVERRHDPLREGKLDQGSSSEESSTDEDTEDDNEEVEEEAELAPSKEEVPIGEVSTRIAIVNLDWDNIRAQDLMAVFSSFSPSTGRLLKAAVYPSEFGRERMEREEMEGPPKEIFAANDKASEDESDSEEEEDEEDIKNSIIKPDDGSEFDSAALRQYQLERLRYYYAVLTFSNKATAKAIYDAVDGTEYLSTANFFDLRFIPEDMDFSQDKPRDACEQLPSGYKPNEFVTDALQHSKVKLTWDQEDRSRKDAQARAFKGGRAEIDENDLKAYLGSDSSEDEDDGTNGGVEAVQTEPTVLKKEQERQKARALLGLAPEPVKKSSKKDKDNPVGNIQVTFSSGLAGGPDGDKKRSVFENSPEPEETTVERYIRKEKERKQKRKEKMKSDGKDAADSADEQYADAAAAEDITAGEDQDPATTGFDDPFFAEETLNDAQAKNKLRKEERLKKRKEREAEEAASAKQRAELELLMAEDDAEAAQAKVGAAGKGRTVRHFDMADVEKAEKKKGKKEKYKSKRQKEREEAAVQDDFKMDTADPRFGKLFENHEFAIDPTNQKLRQTKGMREVMEESRRRKQKGDKSDVSAEANAQRLKKEKKNGGTSSSEVQDLVAKLKRKAT